MRILFSQRVQKRDQDQDRTSAVWWRSRDHSTVLVQVRLRRRLSPVTSNTHATSGRPGPTTCELWCWSAVPVSWPASARSPSTWRWPSANTKVCAASFTPDFALSLSLSLSLEISSVVHWRRRNCLCNVDRTTKRREYPYVFLFTLRL